MKSNLEANPLPELSLPRLCSKLECIADNVGRFAREFGVEVGDNFGTRLATIGFANAIVLSNREPHNAAKFEELLTAEAIPSPQGLAGVTPAFITAFSGEREWTYEVSTFLRARWNQSTEVVPENEFALESRLRLLHGIRIGFIVARESPETAAKIQEQIRTLWVENQFLSGLLYFWSDNDWKPYAAPFVEFAAMYYRSGSAERRILGGAVAEIYPIAKALSNPWSVSFWVELGWNGGQRLAHNSPAELRALLEEAPRAELQACHRLYQTYLLGSARSGGEVQIERAALRFIGEQKEPDLARSYCTGREPRRLARVVYDFAFWMGIFASHPVPVLET